MTAIVAQWTAAVADGALDEAARLWATTPHALAAAFAREQRAARFDGAGEVVLRDDDARIVRLRGAAAGVRLHVGVQETGSGASLVSPHSIARRQLARSWTREVCGEVTIVAQRADMMTNAARLLIERSVGRIRRSLALPPRAITYYVPDGATHGLLLAAERGATTRQYRFASWTDPFCGDVISRDPADRHELAHACILALPGWPPAALREGIAECYAPPVDVDAWMALQRSSTIFELWNDSIARTPGWHTGSALLAAFLYHELGPARFTSLYNDLDDAAPVTRVALAVGTTVPLLERSYAAFAGARETQRHLRAPHGLLAGETMETQRCSPDIE